MAKDQSKGSRKIYQIKCVVRYHPKEGDTHGCICVRGIMPWMDRLEHIEFGVQG